MKNKFSIAMSLAVVLAMLLTSLALASAVDFSVVDVTAPTGSVTLAPSASGPITINMSVTGKQEGTATFEVYRDWTLSGGIFTGSNPQTFTVPARAAGDPATTFSASGTVAVAAGQGAGTFTLDVSAFGITNSNPTGAKLSDGADGLYHVTVSIPPTNTPTPPPTDTATPPPTDTPTPTPIPDTTPPVITPNVSGTLGNNGWYVSDVALVWTVTDPESAVSKTGCVDQTITADQAATDYSCSASSAGGSTGPVTVSIKRDATAPTISAAISAGTLGLNSWYTSDVTVHFTCNDSGSGIPLGGCPADQVLSAEGPAVSSTAQTVTDAAGNTSDSSNVVTVNIDKTAPTISAAISAGTLGLNSWYVSDVTVHFTCSDGGSGIPLGACPADQVLSAEGAGISSTAQTVTDAAGNTSDSSNVVTVNIDKTAPTISAAATTSPNLAGWYNSDVTVHFTCSDGGSGIPSGACPADQVLSAEGAAVSSTAQTVTDAAGNTSDPSNVVTVKIDKTAPTVALVGGPTNGASYYFGSVPAAPSCNASDGLSGLNGLCSVSGYDTIVGSHTVTASASDNAGNSNSASATYTVLAWSLSGFYQPVDMNGVFNVVKGGSTVPLKFEVFAASELTSTSVVKSFVVTQIACNTSSPIDDIELTTTGGTSLRYDTTGGQFIQNWQTPRSAGSCYRVTMTTQDGSSLVAFFKLK